MKWLASSMALTILNLVVVGLFYAGSHLHLAFAVVAFAFMFAFVLAPVTVIFAIRDLLFQQHRAQALISLVVALPLCVLLYFRMPHFLG